MVNTLRAPMEISASEPVKGKGMHHVHLEEIFTERKFRGLKFSLYLRRKWCYYLLSLFSVGHGDKVTVNMLNAKGVIIPGGMIKICLGQVFVWNFPTR